MIGFNHLGRLGRFGNQMFQYAALRGIAANNNTKSSFSSSTSWLYDGSGDDSSQMTINTNPVSMNAIGGNNNINQTL